MAQESYVRVIRKPSLWMVYLGPSSVVPDEFEGAGEQFFVGEEAEAFQPACSSLSNFSIAPFIAQTPIRGLQRHFHLSYSGLGLIGVAYVGSEESAPDTQVLAWKPPQVEGECLTLFVGDREQAKDEMGIDETLICDLPNEEVEAMRAIASYLRFWQMVAQSGGEHVPIDLVTDQGSELFPWLATSFAEIWTSA